jgi:thiol:disulfide interchange protein DsbC
MISYSRIVSVFLLAGALLGSAATFAESTIDEIGERISTRLPGFVISSLTETEVPALYELVSDGRIYYIDESAEYLIDGSLIRLEDRRNVTDSRLGSIHMGLIEDLDEKNMLIYEPKETSTRSITVFTDISCGYCRRLHAEIGTLLDEGIRVRYLMFPRAGMGSQGHKVLESVWCADDPQGAMTNAKSGGRIDPKTCPNPIAEHVALAERLGLRGTPLIYTDSGEKIPGYREASALALMIENSESLTR